MLLPPGYTEASLLPIFPAAHCFSLTELPDFFYPAIIIHILSAECKLYLKHIFPSPAQSPSLTVFFRININMVFPKYLCILKDITHLQAACRLTLILQSSLYFSLASPAAVRIR